MYRQVAYSLLIQLRVNRVVNISILYFSSKICTYELMKMNSENELHFYKQSICFYTKLIYLENTTTFHTVHDSCRIGTTY